MITLRLRHIILFTFAFLLTACQFEDSADCPNEEHFSSSYINLTIAVSNGHGRTRANMPLAGENGNGREAGFERENAVTGITLILYQSNDNDAINTEITETNNPVLDFVRFYPVTRIASTTASQGTSYTAGTGDGSHSGQIEASYTTGPQSIGKMGALSLDLNATYHAIVVANYDLTTGSQALTEKTSKLSNVRDIVLTKIASGSYTDAASSIGNFVMSSEEDNTLSLKNVTGTNLNGTPHILGQDILYDLTAQPLIIERMAARIDFWAKGANYQTKNGTYSTSTNDGNGTSLYATPGYVYTPVKADGTTLSSDRFVVTRITPFNLNNGSSYLLKHLSDGRLKSETGSNYVIDPATENKIGTPSEGSYISPLSEIVSGLASWNGHTIEAMHAQVVEGLTGGFSYTSDGFTAEDIIVCYPKENTLPDESPLYGYATGIVIEGDYYTNDDVNQREHRVYFTYIRHQGESENAYEAMPSTQFDDSDMTSSSYPMNFGIVRNNIYRISIDKVYEKEEVVETPKITLQIKVKKWDKFEHAPIYM